MQVHLEGIVNYDDGIQKTMKTILMTKFTEFMLAEMQENDWTQAGLARKAKLSRGTIANLLSENRKPGPDTCKALAIAFNLPPEMVFRKAGLLPGKDTSNGE